MRKNEITEERIVKQYCEIAFSESNEVRDGDRMRALDWLSDYLKAKKDRDEVMKKLDEVLALLDPSASDHNPETEEAGEENPV